MKAHFAMRIQPLSDLHLEFYGDSGQSFVRNLPVLGDVLVLAGDVLVLRSLDEARRTFGWFCDRFSHVVFVPGNHEYHENTPATVTSLLEACSLALPNLHVLNANVAVIDGARFVGAPLWFPQSSDEPVYRPLVADFARIREFVPWVHEAHAAHLEFLRTSVNRGDVVVTHHLPHPRSVAARFLGSPINRYFLAEDAAEIVERSGARLWIHGHTHCACDYVAGDTRVICNPRGYPGETAGRIDLKLVVEH
jgi:predicted phosphohydrolase